MMRYAAKFSQEVLIGEAGGNFAARWRSLFLAWGSSGLRRMWRSSGRKRLGIRKVLGASVMQLWVLLSREFIVLVMVSCLIAAPIAFYFMHGWLQTYDYRIGIGPGVFYFAPGRRRCVCDDCYGELAGGEGGCR